MSEGINIVDSPTCLTMQVKEVHLASGYMIHGGDIRLEADLICGDYCQLAGRFTIAHGKRIKFGHRNIIHKGSEFKVEHPRGPVDWNGSVYR